MKKLYVVFPDNFDDYVPVNDMIVPAILFQNAGAHVVKQTQFFQEFVSKVKEDDLVMIYVSLQQKWREVFKNIKCVKILKNVDPAKSDGILFKNDLLLHEEIGGFDRWFITVASVKNLEFLKNKGIRADSFTHCLDFNDMVSADDARKIKSKDVIVSGQQHEKFYPDRWRLMQYFCTQQQKYSAVYLPHPGFEISGRRHDFIGNNYVNLLLNFWTGPVGVGHADGLHMKFLEMAKAYVLPLGSIPSYMKDSAAKNACVVGLGESDDEMIKIIDDLFSDREALWQRITDYSATIRQSYDANIIIPEIYRSIMENNSPNVG